MFRFIVPTILIVIAIAGFLTFTNPIYKDISALKVQMSSYDEALANSKALENERDKLTKKYNAINADDLARIQKLLPDSVDNIRLILEMEKVAAPYGMQLRDVRYDASGPNTPAATTGSIQGGSTDNSRKDFGTWSLSFSVEGTYDNFISFLKDLEKNLRIVDVASVSFSSDTGSGINPTLLTAYRYSIKINTYWLKN